MTFVNGRRWAALLVVVTLGVLPMVLSANTDEFEDVPADHVFHDDVGWLAEEGITFGCNPPENDRFCPDDVVTRGQMAAFLVRGLGLSEAGDQGFVDTNGVFADDVDRLAAASITFGCNPPENDRFCPEAEVTRGQMAAFLVRGLGLSAASDQGFVDTDGVFSEDVDRLAAAGITYGCNPPENDRFCPDDVVTRGQMAAFLHRGLEQEDPPGTTTTTSTSTSTTSSITTSTTSSTTTTSVATTTTTEPPATTVPTPGLEVVSELPGLILFETYEGVLEASGGSGSYTWEVDGLPQGLILDPEFGVISTDPSSPPVIGAGDPLVIMATVTDTIDGDQAQREIEIPVVGGAALASQGAYSTCAMTTEATAYCWGFNGQGQLGDGTTEWSTVPVGVQNPEGTGPLTGIVDLDMRGTQPGHHACAVTDETRAYCWGSHNWGELGNPDGFDDGLPRHALPIVVLDPEGQAPLEGVTQVAAGDYHTCAVTEENTAFCWGNNEQGQLGNPAVDEGPRPHTLLAVPVMDPTGESPITGIARIDTGNGHTCAMTTDGGVYCWGLSNGGLGDGETTQSDLPVRVMGADGTQPLGDITDITVANFHSCALLSDGTAQCWGGNLDGQLGNPAFPDGSPFPVEVRNPEDDGPLTGIDQLSAGTWHTCARIDDTARCWGSNGWGKLGNGVTDGSSLPVTVLSPDGSNGFSGLTEIEAGQNHTCAMTDDGATYCWGLNLHAQLGNGKRDTIPPSPNPLPTPVHPIPAVIPPPDITTATLPAVHVFEGYATQLEVEGGEPPYEWQVDGLPQGMVATETGSITRDPAAPILDSAETVELTVTVTDAAGGTDVAQLNLETVGVSDISTGQDHTCAVTSDSVLYCWGRNGAGQLGDGTTEDRHLPTPVTDPDDPEGTFDGVTVVSTSQAHTCAITADTTLYCWG
ncbi:MAG: hypothetical protein GEU79_13405, partial [Acidimicrobiia bacterium]|nr:hypothetical protein [Acidimicrobiia bacterium]